MLSMLTQKWNQNFTHPDLLEKAFGRRWNAEIRRPSPTLTHRLTRKHNSVYPMFIKPANIPGPNTKRKRLLTSPNDGDYVTELTLRPAPQILDESKYPTTILKCVHTRRIRRPVCTPLTSNKKLKTCFFINHKSPIFVIAISLKNTASS